MLNTAQTSLQDVLSERRQQLPVRLAISLILIAVFSGFLGWHVCLYLSGLYLALQAVETFGFSERAPWFGAGGTGAKAGLVVLTLNSLVFSAPTLFLAQRMGEWGDVCAVYLLCGSILNTVLTSIGCRPAFYASTLPHFFYLALLPFNALALAQPPSALVFLCLSSGGIFLIFNVTQLWRRWSLGKAAEIKAVQRYIAARDENERRLFEMTQHDALTGLSNRTVLQEKLAQNARHGGVGALLVIDLDGFKYVNDTLGHSAGDKVLCEIAGRIQPETSASGTAARLGGDEFALALPNIKDPADATAMAERLIAKISQPVMLDGQPINIGASIGIVLHPLHGDDAEQLFSNADLALYQAKAEGRQCARLYHPFMRAMAQGKVLRDTELRQAIDRSEFELFYQPQIGLADGELRGAEALLRWHHPEHGLLPPARFLPALEGGLHSAQVGAWAIATACRQAAAWRAGGCAEFRIGVNIFGAQFRSGNLVEWVMQACTQASLPPAALEIEITENVMLRHEDSVIGPLQVLRAQGVGVAFDDFGTGFASLSMLTRYPVSRLKIDQQFTKAICESRPDAAVIHAVINLAKALHLQVTAEGVETRAQAEALRREGCAEGQGFYFGAPMNAKQFEMAFGIGQHRRTLPAATLKSAGG